MFARWRLPEYGISRVVVVLIIALGLARLITDLVESDWIGALITFGIEAFLVGWVVFGWRSVPSRPRDPPTAPPAA